MFDETSLARETTTTDTKTDRDRSFEARFGESTVSRGIAAFPSLLLRWQKELELKDEHIVTIVTILSFYSAPPAWPSVSMEKMAEWRGLSWRTIQTQVKELEALGYLKRTGRDAKHQRSYFFDLSELLQRLQSLGSAETEMARVRKEQSDIKPGALIDLRTRRQANREPNSELVQLTAADNFQQKSVVENANSVLVNKPAAHWAPEEPGPTGTAVGGYAAGADVP